MAKFSNESTTFLEKVCTSVTTNLLIFHLEIETPYTYMHYIHTYYIHTYAADNGTMHKHMINLVPRYLEKYAISKNTYQASTVA